MTDPARTVRAVIKGRVQGVWYRGWTVETARALGLRGWVRNRNDGSVEAVFSGPPPAVEEMIDRCHQGPPAARVQSVVLQDMQDDVPPGFRQLPNAT